MRGKDPSKFEEFKSFGITPAYAGKRCGGSGGGAYSKDHPRLCGEKSAEKMAAFTDLGSPPPMRGKGKMAVQVNRETRITPAYAGKSSSNPFGYRSRKDHPRLCGEKRVQKCRCGYGGGSPPPMRGKVSHSTNSGSPVRITPAYAGKSDVTSNRDKPHKGSPPPMRGKAVYAFCVCCNYRITPAYAGKSGFSGFSLPLFQDHPRLCGEKICDSSDLVSVIGSPPPMRGKEDEIFSGYNSRRITPAYAGKSVENNAEAKAL